MHDADMKLFIGGLNYRTTEVDLERFFGAHKITLLSCLIAKDAENMSRCFGFVTVADIDADAALKIDKKFIGGNKVSVKKPGIGPKKKAAPKSAAPQRTLFK